MALVFTALAACGGDGEDPPIVAPDETGDSAEPAATGDTGPASATGDTGADGTTGDTGLPGSDSDGDALDDCEEAAWGTDPLHGDTDRDGVPDGGEALVIGTDPAAHGEPCLAWPSIALPGHVEAEDVAVGDLDLDGHADVLVASDSGLKWLAGPVSAFTERTIDTGAATSVTTADLDQDGDADVVATLWTGTLEDSGLCTYENLGDGTFGPRTIRAASTTDDRLSPVDLDADGDLDVVWSQNLRTAPVLWAENVDGALAVVHTLLPTVDDDSVSDHVVADLDADGDDDVVVMAERGRVELYRNLGGGVFGPSEPLVTASGWSTIEVADLDVDGDLDLIAEAGWFENLGGGAFGPEQPAAQVDADAGARAADADRDGDPDLILVGSDDVWYVENLGGGAFGAPLLLGSAERLTGVVVADLDADRDPDVLLAARFDDPLVLLDPLPDDADGDGLGAEAEVCIAGTDPLLADTDGGGTADLDELWAALDPSDPGDDAPAADADGDGLADGP